MKQDTYGKQKVFAGKLKPSKIRRCVEHDYAEKQIYMFTMTKEDCYSLFGLVEGKKP